MRRTLEGDRGRERGFGLLLVVVVLALLGLLALSTFGIARREFRGARDLGYAAEAFEAAESGLAAAASIAPGFAVAPPMFSQPGPGAVGGRTRFATTVVRLNGSVMVLRATGERLGGAGEVLSRRRLGLVGKIIPATGASAARFQPLDSRGWVQIFD